MGGEEESVAVALARMEGKIDTNFAIIRGDLGSQGVQLQDHESRVRSLEADAPSRKEIDHLEAMLAELNRWRWKLIGFFTAISVVASFIATVIESTVFHN